MIKQKKLYTSDKKFIEIYDDIFPPSLREYHMMFALESKYMLGSRSTGARFESNTFFQSKFTKEDFENFNIYDKFLEKRLENYEINSCWILASSPLSTYYYHPDNRDNGITLLYYLNYKWDRDWGGETLFANDVGECEIAVEYKPGRVVIFDSTIEHKPSAVSMQADEFRFTFVIQFKLKC